MATLMPGRDHRATTPGEVAVFFLIAGMAPPLNWSGAGIIIDGHSSATRDEVVKKLNEATKPIFCRARLVGPSVEITTYPITNRDALRARAQYLSLAARDLLGLDEPPSSSDAQVLLKSDYAEMVVSAQLLRRYYEEYDIPHSSSQMQSDVEEQGPFTGIVHVFAAGTAELAPGDLGREGEENG